MKSWRRLTTITNNSITHHSRRRQTSFAPARSESIDDHIAFLMSQKATPLSLSSMYKYAAAPGQSFSYYQRLCNAQFLHSELQIRIAHRLADLKMLPFGLADTCQILNVRQTYKDYLVQFMHCPLPKKKSEEADFTDMIQHFVLDRHSIPSAVHSALINLKSSLLSQEEREKGSLDQLELHIQKYMMARIGLRFLVEHHVLCSPTIDLCAFRKHQGYIQDDDDDDHDDPNNSYHSSSSKGAISTSVDPVREVKRVAKQVMEDCKMTFGVSPEIEVIDSTNSCTFTYVPHHLHYMLAELLKNSCRAVVRKHWYPHVKDGPILTSLQQSAQILIPSIQVVVVKGEEDITIKISDRGGGIPRSICDNMWTFVHSTLMEDNDNANGRNGHRKVTALNSTNFDKNAFTNHVHGRSFGLPMAKIYVRYFGGELTIKSMEGFGVDSYLYLPVLGKECENLPKLVYYSPGNLDSSIEISVVS